MRAVRGFLAIVFVLFCFAGPAEARIDIAPAVTVTSARTFAIPNNVTTLSITVTPSGTATVCAYLVDPANPAASCEPWSKGTISSRTSTFYLPPVRALKVTPSGGSAVVEILGGP